MSYTKLPTRTSADTNSAADINQLQTNLTSVLPQGLYNNALINPYMIINQRDAVAGIYTNNTYVIDRWRVVQATATVNVGHQTISQPTDLPYSKSLNLIEDSISGGTGKIGIAQELESDNAKFFQGKEVNASAWVKSASTNARVLLYDGTTYTSSSTHTGDNTWQKLTVTATMASSLTSITVAAQISTATNTNVAYNINDGVNVTGVKLVLSDSETNDMPRQLSEELALCKRYYQRVIYTGVQADPLGMGWANSTSQVIMHVNLPVQLRTTPTITVVMNFVGDITAGGSIVLSGAVYGNIANSNNGVVFSLNDTSAFVLNNFYSFLLTPTFTDEGIRFDAEV